MIIFVTFMLRRFNFLFQHFLDPPSPFDEVRYGWSLNIVSGSEANMTTPCEMDFFNFLWLILDHYIPLGPT